MKALILAGGLGTRLRPLTYTRPKHLLPVVNRAHIDHVFDLLLRHGVDQVVLLTSHLAEAFADVSILARERGLEVEVTHEEEPLGTAGALRNAAELVASDTFLVLNGDILTDLDLTKVIEWHRERSAEASIVLTPVEDPSAFGVVPTQEDGRVLGFIEKPPPGEAPTNLINAGVYIFEPSILDRIPAGEVYSAERQLFPGLVDEGADLFATGTDAYWMDIGTPEKYLQANLDALAGRFICASVDSPSPDGVVASSEATIDDTARVSSSCLGRGTVVGSGARVEMSVLLPGARIDRDAVVRRSILGEKARIGPGMVVEGRTLADDESV